ncbi:hypothetical protein K2173_004910 [Erythroxylum novogranatense]|uniref:Auxin efflux carrier family protein n=1 Tax=Erythroxylum novogranatense TaxID=1862640 RepID=A0AAV8TD61_9ROSI|nr:hypothetical protein K2173_004910 [Erythroxylum novogranatense]
MRFLDLFLVALVPVLKVLLLTALGLFLAIDRIGLLGTDARQHLNKLVFYVFSPAIVFSQLAETITSHNLVELWFMPVNVALTFILGSALAWILIKITRIPPRLHSIVIGCCSAGNLGNLPLIIVPALCKESDSPFGDSTVCTTYGKAYVALSMAVGAICLWTYVYTIMRMYADKNGSYTNALPDDENNYTEALLDDALPGDENNYTEALLDDAPPAGTSIATSGKKATFIGRTFERVKKLTGNINLKRVFAPSTIAAALGFVIGTVSPIRKVMIGESAPLHVLDSSISLIGDAVIPCMTLIVGANLLRGFKRSGVGLRVIVGVIMVRYVFLPVIGIGVVKGAYHFGIVGSDSLYLFVLLLQYALPPALNMGVLVQLFKASESECSVIMMWTYVVATFSLTLWCTFYMWLLG